MTVVDQPFDAIIVGGGPAGSSVGRLLTTWGHRVVVLTRPRDTERGLAESIPPSARKLLQAIGLLDAVERAGFVPNRGNVVWWGTDRARTEDFGTAGDLGFQVYRPRFDAVLLDDAEEAGVRIERETTVRSIELHDDHALVTAERDGVRFALRARFVVDASGRAGVLARQGYRVQQPRHRMQAFVGMWRQEHGFTADVVDRTIIETYEDGWAWSLPVSETVRQIAMMIDGTTTQTSRGPTIADTYRAELAKTRQLHALVAGAVLDRAWACDASMHTAGTFAGPQFILVGDAATCIDPLSSFGVKKALASAWLGAVALHTALVDEDRRTLAFDFFSAREREVYAAELARTEAFAQRALAHHDHPFWGVRGAEPESMPADVIVDRLLRSDAVRAAFARLRAMESLSLHWRHDLTFLKAPRVRGCEIVLDDALPLGGSAVRFAAGVDLVTMGHLAGTNDSVPALFDAYCRINGDVDLSSFLAALSLLIAEGLLD